MADAEIGAGACDVDHGVDATEVSLAAFLATAGGPATVAVHDDGYVPGQLIGVEPGRYCVCFALAHGL